MATSKQTRHIIIGGGSGFIGLALTQALRARGDRVTILSRTGGVDKLTWDDVRDHGLPACDVVVNLAGKHILDMRRLWTRKYRDEVIRSRVETTQLLVSAINKAPSAPNVFISTAGKCFYGSQAFHTTEQYLDLDEYAQPVGIDFPAQLVGLWEQAAQGVDKRVRHVQLRLGIVLGEREAAAVDVPKHIGAYGIFPMLRALYRHGLCLSMGSGVQPFPWVHVDDVVGLFLRAMEQTDMHGIYNAVAPGIVSNAQFTQALAKASGRRVIGRVPAWLIKLVVGVERSTILLLGQRVRPKRTLKSGFVFKYAQLTPCLEDLVTKGNTGAQR